MMLKSPGRRKDAEDKSSASSADATGFTGRAFNLDTVAARLDVKRRFLAGWLRAHPWDDHGQPFYSRIAGKKKLFTENDIARIFAALPKPEPQPAPSIRSVFTTPRRGGSAAQTSESVLTELLERLTKK
jgi:hypothetical protein